METLLIHEDIAPYILTGLEDAFSEHGTILKGCAETLKYIKQFQQLLKIMILNI
jgi:glutamate-5-semialdehyde dehydrogenase